MTNKQLYIVGGALAAVGVVVYFFGAKLFSALKNINKDTPYEGTGAVGTLGNVTNQVLGGVPQAVGEKISSWFAPQNTGENLFYTVLFPDGQRHAVGSTTVDRNGYFMREGKRYRIGINQSNQRVAVAA